MGGGGGTGDHERERQHQQQQKKRFENTYLDLPIHLDFASCYSLVG